VSYVLFPALSRAHAQGQNPAATYLTTLQGVGLVTIPAAVGVVLMAEPLVLILFGASWAASIPVVQALTVVAGLRALGTHAGDLLKASGRPGVLVVLASIKAALVIPVLVPAAEGGIVTVALAMVAVTTATVTLEIAVACLLTRTSGWSVLSSIKPGVAGGAAVAGALALVDVSLPAVAAPVRVLVSLAIGFIAYAWAVHVVSPEIYGQVRQLGRRLTSRVSGEASRLPESPRLATSLLGDVSIQ
jgi:lipopolysaccharide exporter